MVYNPQAPLPQPGRFGVAQGPCVSQPGVAPAPEEEATAKVDRFFPTDPPPHRGQVMLLNDSADRWVTSNPAPQSAQEYSYIGM